MKNRIGRLLEKMHLYDQLKKRRAAEINKSAEKKIRDEYVELSDDDYKRLLADMFIEKFPLLAEKSFLGTPQLMNPKAGDFYEVAKQKLFTIVKAEEGRLKNLPRLVHKPLQIMSFRKVACRANGYLFSIL